MKYETLLQINEIESHTKEELDILAEEALTSTLGVLLEENPQKYKIVKGVDSNGYKFCTLYSRKNYNLSVKAGGCTTTEWYAIY